MLKSGVNIWWAVSPRPYRKITHMLQHTQDPLRRCWNNLAGTDVHTAILHLHENREEEAFAWFKKPVIGPTSPFDALIDGGPKKGMLALEEIVNREVARRQGFHYITSSRGSPANCLEGLGA